MHPSTGERKMAYTPLYGSANRQLRLSTWLTAFGSAVIFALASLASTRPRGTKEASRQKERPRRTHYPIPLEQATRPWGRASKHQPPSGPPAQAPQARPLLLELRR